MFSKLYTLHSALQMVTLLDFGELLGSTQPRNSGKYLQDVLSSGKVTCAMNIKGVFRPTSNINGNGGSII